MRTLTAMLGALLLLVLSTVAVAAQGATPSADQPIAGGTVDPAVGDTATYVEVSGNPVATITVDDVVRNWDQYGEFYEPDPGVEYVAFTITVTSQVTRGAVEVSDYDFSMQDSAGFLWSTAFVDAADGVEVTPLEDDLALANGETATFLVVFEVLQDQPLAHLFWQPDTGRLITVASLEGV